MKADDIIFSLRTWQLYGYKFIDWCAVNVGREKVDWEKGIEVVYVPGQPDTYKYATIRIYDDEFALLFRMQFSKHISSRAKETGVETWKTFYS